MTSGNSHFCALVSLSKLYKYKLYLSHRVVRSYEILTIKDLIKFLAYTMCITYCYYM